MNPRIWYKVAAVSGVTALGLASYGAFGFKPNDTTYKEVWNTASLFQLAHVVGLAAAPMTKRPNIYGALSTAGIIVFSGSCYTVAYLEDRKYAKLAPYGGVALVAAGTSLIV